jgi:hypothetical protein
MMTSFYDPENFTLFQIMSNLELLAHPNAEYYRGRAVLQMNPTPPIHRCWPTPILQQIRTRHLAGAGTGAPGWEQASRNRR